LDLVIGFVFQAWDRAAIPGQKKADVAQHPEVLGHVGLLVNGPPGTAELPFIQSSDVFDSVCLAALVVTL